MCSNFETPLVLAVNVWSWLAINVWFVSQLVLTVEYFVVCFFEPPLLQQCYFVVLLFYCNSKIHAGTLPIKTHQQCYIYTIFSCHNIYTIFSCHNYTIFSSFMCVLVPNTLDTVYLCMMYMLHINQFTLFMMYMLHINQFTWYVPPGRVQIKTRTYPLKHVCRLCMYHDVDATH